MLIGSSPISGNLHPCPFPPSYENLYNAVPPAYTKKPVGFIQGVLQLLVSEHKQKKLDHELRHKARNADVDIEEIEQLMKSGASVLAKSMHGKTALHYASATGNVALLIYLIKQGANIEARSNLDWTPLHYAAITGEVEATYMLLWFQANREAKGNGGLTPEQIAKLYRHDSVVKLLKEYDGSPPYSIYARCDKKSMEMAPERFSDDLQRKISCASSASLIQRPAGSAMENTVANDARNAL